MTTSTMTVLRRCEVLSCTTEHTVTLTGHDPTEDVIDGLFNLDGWRGYLCPAHKALARR